MNMNTHHEHHSNDDAHTDSDSQSEKEEGNEFKQGRWVRLVCLSDTHTKHRDIEVPDGDILIHTGDFTERGPLDEVKDFNDWMATLPHRHKIVVAGNHEMALVPLRDRPDRIQALLDSCTYLQDSTVTIEGIEFYGSPWTARNKFVLATGLTRWIFGKVGHMGLSFGLSSKGEELRSKWEAIPASTDILLTHMPPQGVLDVFMGDHMGCPHLAKAVRERVRPVLHIFGHNHDCHGIEQQSDPAITYVNGANMLPQYREPIVLDYNVTTKEVKVLAGN